MIDFVLAGLGGGGGLLRAITAITGCTVPAGPTTAGAVGVPVALAAGSRRAGVVGALVGAGVPSAIVAPVPGESPVPLPTVVVADASLLLREVVGGWSQRTRWARDGGEDTTWVR